MQGEVRKRKKRMKRGQSERIRPKGAVGPKSPRRMGGRSRESMVKSIFMPMVIREKKTKSQKWRSLRMDLSVKQQEERG